MFVDLHSHILPQVDDGPHSIDESRDILKVARRAGITHMVATPHWGMGNDRAFKDKVLKKFHHLKEECKDIDIEIYLGAETYYNADVYYFDKLSDDHLLTINNSKYVLVETPYLNNIYNVPRFVYEVCIRGYVPIIAHPERYPFVINDEEWVKMFVNEGGLVQLTLGALETAQGTMIKKAACNLLEEGLVHFVASDAHDILYRTPDIRKGLNILKNLVDKKYYQNLTKENALKVLQNKKL